MTVDALVDVAPARGLLIWVLSVRLGTPRWSRLFVEPPVLPQLTRRCGLSGTTNSITTEETKELPAEPVRHLHQERVVRARAEEVPVVPRCAERPLIAIVLESALSPDHEEGGRWTVFPAKHRAGVELLLVEA